MSDFIRSLTGHECVLDSEDVCTLPEHAHAELYAAGWCQGQAEAVGMFGRVLDGGIDDLPDNARPCAVETECGHTTCIVLWICAGAHESVTRHKWNKDHPMLSQAVEDAIERS